MNLEELMLSEINQTAKGKYCMIPLRIGKFIGTESRIEVTLGERGMGVIVYWVKSFVQEDERVLETDSNGHTTL